MEDDRMWLTYWACFACFLVFDQIVGRHVLRKVLPFYFFLKIFFLVYLFHPNTLGARNVYHNLIVPISKNHQVLHEQFLDEMTQAMQNWTK